MTSTLAARLPRPALRAGCLARRRRVSLCETLDRVLNKGVVVTGDLTISIADIDLVYVGVNLLLASVETMRAGQGARGEVRGNAAAASPAARAAAGGAME